MKAIKLKKGQYLNEIEPFKSEGIPNNTILHKQVTGCGITTFAIRYFNKHTIIILPNRPVIEDKVAKHNEEYPEKEVLAVHKGVEIDDIVDYLQCDVVYKKILTTPEGFASKVVPAFGEQRDTMLNHYFLLLDECERVITDVSYRGKITLPFDMFFHFKEKAMVSATVLPFTDPRLANFQKAYIQPKYRYSKLLTVVETNNVIEALKKRIDELNTKQVFIFLNSTDTIFSIIERLGIKSESHVYCSQTSAYKLYTKGFKNAFEKLDSTRLAKYNFLTSRFFSAFDIKLSTKPDVIMVTDVYLAEHSILDPQTEVIQIAGRCRNGLRSLTHISNFNPLLNSKNKDEALYYLQGCFDTYHILRDLYIKETHPGSKETLKEALTNVMAHSFYDDGGLNYFMVDNYINEQRVKAYYQNSNNLLTAYLALPNHFKVRPKVDFYSLSDEDRARLITGKTLKARKREIAHQLYQITPRYDYYPVVSLDLTNYLRGLDSSLTTAFDAIGFDGLEQTGYVNRNISKALRQHNLLKVKKEMSQLMYEAFEPNKTYPETDVRERIELIRQRLNLPGKSLPSMVGWYFNAKRSTRAGVNVWSLNEAIEIN